MERFPLQGGVCVGDDAWSNEHIVGAGLWMRSYCGVSFSAEGGEWSVREAKQFAEMDVERKKCTLERWGYGR